MDLGLGRDSRRAAPISTLAGIRAAPPPIRTDRTTLARR
jgi:hypothetical protein